MSIYKLGRREPSNAPALLFKTILKAIPAHPVASNYLTPFDTWKVLGNFEYGDCVSVSWSNMRRLMTATLTDHEVYPTLEQVLELYKTQNPNFPDDDMGMDIQVMLNHIRKNGDPLGTKPLAFSKLDVHNLQEIKAALYIFGGLILGVAIQQGGMNDFGEGRPMDWHAGEDIIGLHAVLTGGYMGNCFDDVRFITWGRESAMTAAFWQELVANRYGEAWVVIWPENLGTRQFIEGIDLPTLASAFKDLTDEELPIPILDLEQKVEKLWTGHPDLHLI